VSSIAIVGMGCRFAGAQDLHSYWSLTREGRHAFGPVPEDRWPHSSFYSDSRRATDMSYAAVGGFIDDVHSFPALQWGIPPRRVEVMDPQQRLSIEIATLAIHDAGYTPSKLPRRTGVFMGVTANEFRQTLSSRITAQMMATGMLGDVDEDGAAAIARAVENVVPPRPFSAPGVLSNMVAAAVAQELDLHGPAYTVDAACASALMAVSDAVAQLRSGQLDVALAGGVYLQLSPENYIAFSRIGAMSQKGLCRPFDAEADGFVQGDGAGVMVLKRLEDAQRDGDRIYAVIEGIATNNDGRGDGPMAPVLSGQIEAIELAWRDAGLPPRALGYMETHGTGTTVGDATELQGLRTALDGVEAVALGSSKANVGHTMSAAGIAGLIRAALAIHHRTIPPMASFESAKEELQLEGSPWHVPTSPGEWSAPRRVAGVSSFGFGGTNGHAVLASTPDEPVVPVDEQLELVCLSAPSEAALASAARRLAQALRDEPASVAQVARAWAPRDALPHRAALVAGSTQQLVAQLDELADGGVPRGAALGEALEQPRIALLFPGQGAQRVGMLRDLAERFPTVRTALQQFEQALGDTLPVPLTHLIWPELRAEAVDEAEAARQLAYTANTQPALVAIGLALYTVLEAIGLQVHVATGHSLGEFCAAAVAGWMSPVDAVRFAAARGAAMAAVQGDPGRMAALLCSAGQARALLAEGVVLANLNHPQQVVVSGTSEGVQRTIEAAQAAGIEAKPLVVSHAFHSPIFEGLDLADAIESIDWQQPNDVVVASGISDRPWASVDDAKGILARHAASPVDFERALRQVADEDVDIYLQVGAGGPLASFARKGPGAEARAVLTLSGMSDDDAGRSLLETLGWLWCHGAHFDRAALAADHPVASVPAAELPREPYWPVKAKRQRKLDVAIAETASVAAAAAPAASTATAPAESSDSDDVFDKVAAVVSKVSSYPRRALKPTQTLVDDLGFDSLMVADLATGLAEAFPGMGGLPQELMLNQPTVQDLVDHVRTGGEGPSVDDDAPLTAYVPVWRDAPELPASGDLSGHSLQLAGEVPAGLGAALKGAGATLSDDGDWVVWCASPRDPVPPHAVLAGEAAPVDRSAELIALLADRARRGRPAHVLVVHRDDDVWAEAEAAVARCIGREWPGHLGRSVALSGTSAERAVPYEITTTDRSTASRWHDGQRQLRGFEPAADRPRWSPGSDDVVLVTGGTRGIGAKLAQRLAATGAKVLLVGRSAPDPSVAGIGVHLAVDVTDRDALLAAAAPHGPVTAVVHSAGVLADGALDQVDPERGALARAVKVAGFANALATAGNHLKAAVAVGSWAGRFGNRHQAHYAAGNALMASLGAAVGAATSEFGPWSSSTMVQSIPAAVQAAMRSEGIDFVGDEAGLDALWADLVSADGVRTRGRALPWRDHHLVHQETLSVESHPYLADHAIAGTPVLPLAAATDHMAAVAALPAPFEVRDVTLYQGVTVDEPVTIEVSVRGQRAELRMGERRVLAYRATVAPVSELPEVPAPLSGGGDTPTSVERFYDEVTFHGPLLAGIVAIDGVGDDFVRGRVRPGRPTDWVPGSSRSQFTVDPLALDSAMQLTALVAYDRYRRAGTPVSLARYVQLAPFGPEPLHVEARFDEPEGDRFSASFVVRDGSGRALALVEGAAAELRRIEGEEEPLVIDPAWVDPTTWAEVRDLDQRLQAAQLLGIRNPYFQVHEGTARDTTVVGGKQLQHYSGYNYLGLSGDPRVLEQVKSAVDRYGTSVSASRVASGERPFHRELEAELAEAQGLDDTLVFTAGHMTNVNVIGHLMKPGDLVLHDEFIHDSALQGIKLSGAGRRGFRHEDPDHLEQLLRELRSEHEKVLIIVEGVYSMDGDICDLPRYLELKKRYGCLLMVDEAHSFGVIGARGCGVGEHFPEVDPKEVDLWMGTLSKSLASCGGWIGGSTAMIRYLRYTAPGFVYSAGITPANAVAALSSLRLMLAEPERVQTLQSNARFFVEQLKQRGIDTGPSEGGSAVVPTITGNSMHALMLSQRLQDEGINVQPIVYPAVPDDAARLRFFLSSTHTEEQLAHTAERVADILGAIREEMPV
jgi:8-amino-7-oxononanoate synthase